jgi:triacylglycerol lipase
LRPTLYLKLIIMEDKMTTRHLVDPELAPMLDAFPPLSLTLESLADTRNFLADMNAQMAALIPEFPDLEVGERTVPGPAGAPDVKVLTYRPKKATSPIPAILWIHGGGYVIGDAAGADATAKTIAQTVNCAVVSVDYRLAPETPHPGPVEDCYAALKWLYTNSVDLGVDASKIAIGGDSAGGGMAAGLALLTRDRGEIKLAYQLLIYPMLDDRTVTTEDPHPHAGEFIWTPALNHFGWTSLLGQAPGSEGVSPYAAPARAESLEGLPPAYISVGTLDLFIDEDLEYAKRLIRAGVPTELHIYPGAFHGFPMVADSKVAQAYNRDYLSALGRAFK